MNMKESKKRFTLANVAFYAVLFGTAALILYMNFAGALGGPSHHGHSTHTESSEHTTAH